LLSKIINSKKIKDEDLTPSPTYFPPPVEGKLIRGFEGLDVGDRVRVELTGTDVERGFIHFARAERGQGD
jgi:hypothetical protein